MDYSISGENEHKKAKRRALQPMLPQPMTPRLRSIRIIGFGSNLSMIPAQMQILPRRGAERGAGGPSLTRVQVSAPAATTELWSDWSIGRSSTPSVQHSALSAHPLLIISAYGRLVPVTLFQSACFRAIPKINSRRWQRTEHLQTCNTGWPGWRPRTGGYAPTTRAAAPETFAR